MTKIKSRRSFLKQAALGTAGLSALDGPLDRAVFADAAVASAESLTAAAAMTFPREFTGAKLARIAFPVGGIGTGGVEIGGRGDLRLWQIFNRPESGDGLHHVFPAIHVEGAGGKPFTALLERQVLPPYDLWDYGSGEHGDHEMPRMGEAIFKSGFPVAAIEFIEPACPVKISLKAFSPFSPGDADDSGLPVAVLDYTVENTTGAEAEVSIALSIENPCSGGRKRLNGLRSLSGDGTPTGIFMTDPSLAPDAAKNGSFVLMGLPTAEARLQLLEAWSDPGGSYMLEYFWDRFARDGSLPGAGDGLGKRTYAVGSAAIKRKVGAGRSATFRFVLAWHYPNRTPKQIGWSAPKGMENVNLGNFYATRFGDAWEVAAYAVKNMPTLEAKTLAFVETMRQSTLPAAVKDAAMSNLSTLVSNTSFRMADGSFHGFEGCGNAGGQGFGSCTHVWHYEVATSYVFPALSRSMRETSFDYATEENGHMDFRHKLPLGHEHFTEREGNQQAAADGQMGQIVRLYLDWRISGDTAWMLKRWPGAKRAMAYAWHTGGWDANRDGVMEGAQHNTYDVEFLGPTGMIQTWYLAALRASAAMARAAGDGAFAAECERMERAGSEWTDKHLFQGEFYVQEIRPAAAASLDPRLFTSQSDPAAPYFQIGGACHVDQIVGQYMAGLAGLGDLLSRKNMETALRSIDRYNRRTGPYALAGTQRMYAINDERALRICAYLKKEEMPVNPLFYSRENWCGLEHAVAATMMMYGMVDEGVAHVADVRARHDGERRNPLDEIEWGHHYARSMSSWALIPALSGFRHDAVVGELTVQPPMNWRKGFRCVWTANTGWGEVRFDGAAMLVSVVSGELAVHSLVLPVDCLPQGVALGSRQIATRIEGHRARLGEAIAVTTKESLRVSFRTG